MHIITTILKSVTYKGGNERLVLDKGEHNERLRLKAVQKVICTSDIT